MENTNKEQENVNEWKQTEKANIEKFEKAGDFIQGTYLSNEESKMFPGSYLIRISDDKLSVKGIFVNNIVISLIQNNGIQPGQQIKIVYKGKKKNVQGNREYNDYEVFYK